MARTRKTTSMSSPAEPKPISAASPGSNTNALSTANNEEYIRRRAYELYLERGGQEGFAEQDWLRAESEVRHNTGQRSA